MIQARGDISDFCSLFQTEPSDLFDRSFESMLTAVRDLSKRLPREPRRHRRYPDREEEADAEAGHAGAEHGARKCGKDGRQQAGVLEAALQQQH